MESEKPSSTVDLIARLDAEIVQLDTTASPSLSSSPSLTQRVLEESTTADDKVANEESEIKNLSSSEDEPDVPIELPEKPEESVVDSVEISNPTENVEKISEGSDNSSDAGSKKVPNTDEDSHGFAGVESTEETSVEVPRVVETTKAKTGNEESKSINAVDDELLAPEEAACEDDEVMGGFLQVSDKDKDYEDPMSVDGSDELMEINQTEEDPIFLLNEPTTKLSEEPMEVGEVEKFEKFQETSDLNKAEEPVEMPDNSDLNEAEKSEDMLEHSGLKDAEIHEEGLDITDLREAEKCEDMVDNPVSVKLAVLPEGVSSYDDSNDNSASSSPFLDKPTSPKAKAYVVDDLVSSASDAKPAPIVESSNTKPAISTIEPAEETAVEDNASSSQVVASSTSSGANSDNPTFITVKSASAIDKISSEIGELGNNEKITAPDSVSDDALIEPAVVKDSILSIALTASDKIYPSSLHATSVSAVDNSLSVAANMAESNNPADKSSNSVSETADLVPVENMSNPTEDMGNDEEICIIPDTFHNLAPEKTGSVEVPRIIASISSLETLKVAPATSVRPQRQAAKKAESQIKQIAKADIQTSNYKSDEILLVEPTSQCCLKCGQTSPCKYQLYVAGHPKYLCKEECVKQYRKDRDQGDNLPGRSPDAFPRKCAQCSSAVTGDERNLSWETMDFCNEECLGKYQTELGSFCANCKGPVAATSLGKYCVRFGYDIKQFCCSSCLEEFKKGLKVCSYCQKDISNDTQGFLAPVGDKGQFKDFCTSSCMEKYDYMSNSQPPPSEKHECDVCNHEKVVQVEVILGTKLHKLCSEPCFAAFKFVNKVDADQCEMCKKYFDKLKTTMFSVYYNDSAHDFCSKTCMNVYILANRKIVPCNWCKVKKYNFDMIKRVNNSGQVIMMCSLNCLTLYQVSVNAVSSKKIRCDFCNKVNQAQYHLTMSDATIRNFCAYTCVMAFQGQYSKAPPLTLAGTDKPVIPTGNPKRIASTVTFPRRSQPLTENQSTNSMPVISSVQSLAPNGQTNPRATIKTNNVSLQTLKPQVVFKQQVIVKPPPLVEMRNKSTSCKTIMLNKSASCRPTTNTKETQTDESIGRPIFIPVPIPIYVPAPMHMFSLPFPVPVPFPLPIPVPMFIPTTRNSISGILKEMKRIQEKIPTDPFEAELLMMAEMVADDKKGDNSDSESDEGDNGADDITQVPEASSVNDEGFSPEVVDTSNFGEDMLQMALKMASELDGPAVDLEAELTPSTITAQSGSSIDQSDVAESEVDDTEPVSAAMDRGNRGRKRNIPMPRRGSVGSPNKRGRRVSMTGGEVPLLPPPEPIVTPLIEVEKPDANMCLKYTFGVNAWRQWVNVKNAELEKATSNRKLKLFKSEILQLTSDELNYSLCLFVKEVRKPNGTEYAPDTIYYLVLGIQQYLFENGRIDNIFTDAYYEKFTECLDEVAKKFSLLFNEQQFIVTRVEEEHLWESKQLGAHSPHVLLSTLMFFNTKHFNLTTVEEHMQLSFSHIMKHWKRNPNQPGVAKVPGSRNVLLRFYPPQASLEANSRKKKVYEQQENEEDPLRCPVKLYEFYLSKCPESVKTRNDVFYLLPERSCVPDSPVWYSTMALGKDPLVKMLHRVKMVKEINVALLTS